MFEGPFDLLVYLIEKAQMSIYDIRISEITSQYLEYLEQMQRWNVNVSTEFMVLAAELTEIKSRMMLPKADTCIDTAEAEDPGSVLAERLIAYKQCKKQSEMLAERGMLAAGIFEKPQEDISVYLENPDELLNLGIEEFASAFALFLQKKQRIEETKKRYSEIERDRISTEERIIFIRNRFTRAFAAGVESLAFNELISKKERYDAAISFISVLQMMRDGYLDASQKRNYGEITVKRGARGFGEGMTEDGKQ